MSIDKEKLKILLYGGGAVGSYFAGALDLDGHDVSLLTRGDHLGIIKESGLKMSTHWGKFKSNLKAVESPEGSYDLIILAVKTYSIKEILPNLKKLSNSNNYLLCIQNGTFTYDFLSREIPETNILNGLTYVDAVRKSPGSVDQFGEEAKIIFGKENLTTKQIKDLSALEVILDSEKVQVEFSDNIQKSIWGKLIMVAAIGSMMSFANCSASKIFRDQKLSIMLEDMIKEMNLVAKSINVNLPLDYEADIVQGLRERSGEIHASLKEDLDNQRPLELNEILGEAIKIGNKNKVKMITCKLVFDKLYPFISGGKKYS
ncbi:MAG: ketopantoate reductase family protein [Chloroflexota bacterium]|nr:ketopantoate reductase family protein [Chloroflexota bacterium]